MDPWLTLVAAGAFEVGFTTCLKLEERSKWFIVPFLICAGISFTLLSQAMETIPLGTAYAVWTGIGAVGTVLVGAGWENQGHVDGYGSWEFSVGNGILNNYGTMSFSGSVTLRQHYSLQNRIGATMSLNGSLDAVQGGGVLWRRRLWQI